MKNSKQGTSYPVSLDMQTSSSIKTEPITANSILKVIRELEDKYGKLVNTLKLSQSTFNALYDYFMEPMGENDRYGNRVEIDKTKDRPYDSRSTIFGVRIELDEDMKDGEWKFE